MEITSPAPNFPPLNITFTGQEAAELMEFLYHHEPAQGALPSLPEQVYTILWRRGFRRPADVRT